MTREELLVYIDKWASELARILFTRPDEDLQRLYDEIENVWATEEEST